jgi:uncharacterized protein (TIGR02145 family)
MAQKISVPHLRHMKIRLALAILIVAGCHPSPPPLESGTRVNTFTDKRDAQLYPTMGIAGKLWLARNLDFTTPSSFCYDNTPECADYGRLYLWTDAKKACPPGWHLPSEKEWLDLITAVGGYYDLPTNTVDDPKASFAALTKGSFHAQIGGSRSAEGDFMDKGEDGLYWTSTSCGAADSVSFIVFIAHSGRVLRDCDNSTGWAQSVRCVRDLT